MAGPFHALQFNVFLFCFFPSYRYYTVSIHVLQGFFFVFPCFPIFLSETSMFRRFSHIFQEKKTYRFSHSFPYTFHHVQGCLRIKIRAFSMATNHTYGGCPVDQKSTSAHLRIAPWRLGLGEVPWNLEARNDVTCHGFDP